MFPYGVNLKENKRLKTDEDRKKLKDLKDDIFVNKMNVNKIITNILSILKI